MTTLCMADYVDRGVDERPLPQVKGAPLIKRALEVEDVRPLRADERIALFKEHYTRHMLRKEVVRA